MNTNSVVIHSAALSNVSNSQTIREGSSVYVKILNQVSSNSYTASFAGSRFIVKSNNPLQINSSFVATVKLHNGQVQLVPKTDNIAILKNLNGNFINEIVSDSALKSYLVQLGLVPDGLSFLMLQTVKNFGMKLNVQLLNKIHGLALKYPGREKEVAEIALSLEQKGIAITEAAIESILFGNSDFSEERDSLEEKHENPLFNFDYKHNVIEAFKSFFENILSGNNVSSNNNELTIFNHKGFDLKYSCDFGSWIKIPFDFSYKKDLSVENGSGFVNLFLNEKRLKNIVIKFDFTSFEGKFLLKFNKNRCENIKFGFNYKDYKSIKDRKNHIDSVINKIKTNYSYIDVENIEYDLISDFEIDDKQISIVRGEA